LTGSRKDRDNRKKDALSANSVQPDPRIVALVRLLARQAAQQDFARATGQLGEAHMSRGI
jgi:hypothetical protein